MRALLAIVWAILAALLGWRAVTVKAPEIQEDIRSRTAAVIAPLLPNAGVEVDGRFVTLRGEAPDDAAMQNAIHTARRVHGALGPWNALWVAKTAAAIAPMISAVKDAGGALILSGAVASEAAKTAVADAAMAAFSGSIDNRLAVSEAAAPAELPGLADALGALAEFDSGSAVIAPDRTILSGATGDKAVAAAAAALASAKGWIVNVVAPAEDASAARVAELEAALIKARSDVDAAVARAGELDATIARLNADADAAKARIAELEKLAAGGGDAANKLLADLDAAKAALAAANAAAADCAARALAAKKAATEAKAALDAANKRVAELEAALAAKPAAPALTADACNAAMLAALSAGGVTFETNSAVVTPDGAKVIDAVAKEAVACARDGGLTMEVGGHTDDRGKDDANLKLSQRRAEAVRDALVLRNLPGDAVTAVGYGETKPIAGNETEDGRKANRRIEFTWTTR